MPCIGHPDTHEHSASIYHGEQKARKFVLKGSITMPKGRKGAPQESIDSILLAMSRRDDIDPTTLSHYFDRLDEEWTDGAREKVLHLLHTNDITAHSAAVLILSE